MTNTEILAQKLTVSAVVDQYIKMLNTGEIPEGYSFTAEPSGSKFRIVMHSSNQQSVHAFVDGTTGDILYPAGWKAPTKRVCYNLLTEMELLRKVYATTRNNWAGRYLYADQIKKDRVTFA